MKVINIKAYRVKSMNWGLFLSKKIFITNYAIVHPNLFNAFSPFELSAFIWYLPFAFAIRFI